MKKTGNIVSCFILFCVLTVLPLSNIALAKKETELKNAQIIMAESPPPAYYVMPSIGHQPDTTLRLSKVSEKPNQIIDDEDWWIANALDPITYTVPNRSRKIRGDLPEFVPPKFNGLMVVRVLRSNPLIVIYGRDFSHGSYLFAIDPNSREYLFAFDFSHYEWPPVYNREDKQFIHMATTWAHVEGKTLYVSHSHRTYASSSKGYNAYITAIDISSNTILWRSQPLVSNTSNFVVKDDAIITGYGFTDEKDFLYVLNKSDGRVVQKVPVKTGPSYLVEKNEHLYVRTYNTDYVFHFVSSSHTN